MQAALKKAVSSKAGAMQKASATGLHSKKTVMEAAMEKAELSKACAMKVKTVMKAAIKKAALSKAEAMEKYLIATYNAEIELSKAGIQWDKVERKFVQVLD